MLVRRTPTKFLVRQTHLTRNALSPFQYLVYKDTSGTELKWVSNSKQNGVPQGAVIGGHGENGEIVYMAQIVGRIGFYVPRETRAEYGSASISASLYSTSWDFLVVAYGELKSFIHDSSQVTKSWISTIHVVCVVKYPQNICADKHIGMYKAMKIHDDVIKWKHFPRYWPFVRGIHRSR